jgi:hypothetical protein
MAFSVITDAATSLYLGGATLNGRWFDATNNPDPSVKVKFLYGYGSASSESSPVDYFTTNGSYFINLGSLDADRTIVFDFRGQDVDNFITPPGFVGGGELSFKSYANAMTFGTPTSSNIQMTTANINIDFNPNTWESLADIQAWYRVKSGPGAWVSGGFIYSQQGSSVRNLQYALSSLAPNTVYQFEFRASRNTTNATSLTSTPYGEFTTLGNPVEINIAETATPSEPSIIVTKNSNLQITIAETATMSEVVELIVGKQSIPALIQPILTGSSEI